MRTWYTQVDTVAEFKGWTDSFLREIERLGREKLEYITVTSYSEQVETHFTTTVDEFNDNSGSNPHMYLSQLFLISFA